VRTPYLESQNIPNLSPEWLQGDTDKRVFEIIE